MNRLNTNPNVEQQRIHMASELQENFPSISPTEASQLAGWITNNNEKKLKEKIEQAEKELKKSWEHAEIEIFKRKDGSIVKFRGKLQSIHKNAYGSYSHIRTRQADLDSARVRVIILGDETKVNNSWYSKNGGTKKPNHQAIEYLTEKDRHPVAGIDYDANMLWE